jgi:hypothetical protein
MEDGSIVKSQNINAKLPQRMQVSAMYGSRGGLKGTDEERQKKEQETYEDNVGKVWGKMSRAVPPSGDDDNQAEQDSHLNDLLTGDMDFPSRQNREFGRMNADIFQPLKIGPLGKTDEVTGKLVEIPDVGKFGTSIKPSILQDITDQQKIYIQEKKNIDFKKAKERSGKDLTIAQIVEETELFAAGFAAFDSRKKNDPKTVTSELFCYEPGQYEEWSQGKESSSKKSTDEAGVETETVTPGEGYAGAVQGYTENLGLVGEIDWALEKVYIQSLTNTPQDDSEDEGEKITVSEPRSGLQTAFLTFKHTLRHSLIKLLRADRYGVLANVDPLLPIDFEMEIDGTGGMFPGNSFHSSYLGDSYRRQSVFQMVGVDHTIDSSGWFTTIKGQIRSTSELPPAEMRTDEEIDDADDLEKDKKAAAEAAVKFINFQQDRLKDIAEAREEALSKAKLRGDYEGLIAKFSGKDPPSPYPDRPVDKAVRKLYKAMKGGGTWSKQVYEALKETSGLKPNQDLLKQAFSAYMTEMDEGTKDLKDWLDGDFDNGCSLDNYTQVALIAGYSYGGYTGENWGGAANKDSGPPNAGPWIEHLNNAGTGTDGATRNIKGTAKPDGKYWIND